MIAYLVTAEHAYAMRNFLVGIGSRFARRIALIPCEQILSGRRVLRADCYIFSDLDRLHADFPCCCVANRDFKMQVSSPDTQGLIFVEYLDTADRTGIYRKYGAFVVGARIVPRHLYFSRDWMVKTADLGDPDLLAEELQYLESNPHAAQLLEICRHAGIGYGRIDYSLLDERIQIWEINTNPMVITPPGPNVDVDPRLPVHRRFTELLDDAFAGVDRNWAAL